MDTIRQINKLNNTNYSIWKIKMKMILIAENVWFVVNDKQSTEEQTSAEWLRADQLAKSLILLNLDDNQLYLIANTTTSKEIWNSLQEFHGTVTHFKRMRTIRQLMETKMSGNKTMEEHIAQISNYLIKLSDLDVFGFDHDAVRVTLLLTSLPASYNALIMALEMRPENELTWSIVTSLLIDEYQKQNRSEKKFESHVEIDKNSTLCDFCKKKIHSMANSVLLRVNNTRHVYLLHRQRRPRRARVFRRR